MNKTRTKQRGKNGELQRIKAQLQNEPDFPKCCICGCVMFTFDLMHILPKSIYPEYYTKKENLGLAHRGCHMKFDDNVEFRKQQKHLYKKAASFDKLSADRYFRKNDTN